MTFELRKNDVKKWQVAIKKRMNATYDNLRCFKCLDYLPEVNLGESDENITQAIRKNGWRIYGNEKQKRFYLICKECNPLR